MGEPNLRELEQEVEIARSKLAMDLATLRSPETYSEFTTILKDEATSAKDALIDKAKTSVQSSLESLIEDLKAKAAANPTAVLAVGAGLAWRLIHRPPIASALVGAGLISLFRTNAQPDGRTTEQYVARAKDRLGEQAADFAADVTKQGGRAVEAVTTQVAELAGVAKERVVEASQTMGNQASDVANAAKDRVQEWGSQATTAAKDGADLVKERTVEAASQVMDHMTDVAARTTEKISIAPQVRELSTTVHNAVQNREARDSFLLGAASVAVIAALGIVCQRKLGEDTPGS